jgi:two-component system, cell cycle sensor histidine kinase and response regulator CckA
MGDRAMHVLLVEDNPSDVRLLQELLKEVPAVPLLLTPVERLDRAGQALAEQRFDVILLDLSLPDSQGLATFLQLYHQAMTTPIIVLTGLDDERLAIRAMQAGAQDYLVKGEVDGALLVRSMRYAIERQRTEEHRQRAEHKIREQAALLDIATDAISVCDLDQQISFWNKGAEHLYGWTAAAVMGKNADDLLHKKNRQSMAQIHAALIAVKHKGEWQGELQKITKSRQEIIVESRWTLVRDESGQPKSILIVDTDITEKKQLEAQFFRAQRLESLGTLASGITHDLNNILTPILAAAQLLLFKFPDADERSQQLLQILEINARRGAALVKQVLSFARGVEGKHLILQPKHLMLELDKILRSTFPKSITLDIHVSKDVWSVVGDSTQLQQVLMNLCVNARDAMPMGGTLRITMTNQVIDDQQARLHLGAHSGPYCRITLADTGIGIDPVTIDRIFEPFFTTKDPHQGTGLGLSTTLGILKSHGGFITVTSEVGKGSEFQVFLPAVHTSELPSSQALVPPIGHGELILVVDDEAPIREVMKTSLEAYNYRVVTAQDGVEAVAVYSQYQQQIRGILMDVMMPSMDGAMAIRTIRKIDAQVKIIAVSGLQWGDKLTEANDSGIKKFLAKPFTTHELLETLHGMLQEP